MLELIKNLKTLLITGLKTNYVFVVPDLNVVPQNSFPCYLIKDGPISNVYGAASTVETTLNIEIAILQASKKSEPLITGDASTTSILELAKNVHALLDRRLDLDMGLIACYCEKEKQTEYFMSGSAQFQRKVLTYVFKTQGLRPCAGRN